MIQTNTRTLIVLLGCLVASSVFVQSLHRTRVVAAVSQPIIAQPVAEAVKVVESVAPARKAAVVETIPASKCAVSATKGNGYVHVTPTACDGVAISSITIAVSDKPCSASSNADFRSVRNSTFYNGQYGFFVENQPKCFEVAEITGKYL